MLFQKRKKLSAFLLESFKQNYLPGDPLRHFYDKLYNGHQFHGIKSGIPLRIGQFEPGEKLPKVKSSIEVYHRTSTKLDEKNTLDSLLAIDELEDILRVSVYHFINKSLFSLKFHFPFISDEEKGFLLALLREKYLPEELDDIPDYTEVIGDNGVLIFLTHFVSISYSFLHATTENRALLRTLLQKRETIERRLDEQHLDNLLREI